MSDWKQRGGCVTLDTAETAVWTETLPNRAYHPEQWTQAVNQMHQQLGPICDACPVLTECAAYVIGFGQWEMYRPQDQYIAREYIGNAITDEQQTRLEARANGTVPQPVTAAPPPRPFGRQRCPNGHHYTPENTAWEAPRPGRTKPSRVCLDCVEQREKRKAA
jgi:hypothetical protein